jgi:hypothetical protein
MMVSMSEQMSAFSFSILPAMFSGVDVVDELQYAFFGN